MRCPCRRGPRAGFTLIELLIVIGLLGALSALVLPRFQAQRGRAIEDSLVPAEMMDIRRAFAAFEADCAPTAADRVLVSQYGLEILVEFVDVRGWSFPGEFDPARGRGWRGPYLEAQGRRTVYVEEPGQPLSGAGPTAEIPVIHDPLHDPRDPATAGHYYRVRLSNGTLELVFVGADGLFDTDDDLRRPLSVW